MSAAAMIAALSLATVRRIPAGEAPRRFISKACTCGAVTSIVATRALIEGPPWSGAVTDAGMVLPLDPSDSSRVLVACRGCGKPRIAHPVIGKVNEAKPCNDRCMSATRHVCDCSCGGLNHGAAHG